jgi:serine/threonine-protein kinase
METDEDPVVKRAEARVGTVLKDKWRLDKLLGVGGMASVYAATHRNAKRVAVKMLHPQLSVDPGMRQRFLREGYVANKVGHRGAVAVDDDDTTEDGAAFLVMELLDGETLEARMRRKGGTLPPAEVLSTMDQVLDTLAAAHEHGIVHRDLKPENIFMTREGVVKILDFGIARLREAGSATSTQTGSLMGTPAFMPPEQARGRWDEVDGRSDLWAVGATMFTLLTGHYVHEAETTNEALVMAVVAVARSLGEFDSTIDSSVVAMVDKALSYERSARFQTARDMQLAGRAAYEATTGGRSRMPQLSVPDPASESEPRAVASKRPATPTTGRAVTAPVETPLASRSSRRSPVVPIAVGGAVLLVAGGAFMALRGGSQAAAEPPSSGSTQATSGASSLHEREPEPAPTTHPVVDDIAVVPVDSVPAGETESGQPTSKAKGSTSKAASPIDRPTPGKAGRTAAGSVLPSSKSAAGAATTAQPPPAKKPLSDDPFSKRF